MSPSGDDPKKVKIIVWVPYATRPVTGSQSSTSSEAYPSAARRARLRASSHSDRAVPTTCTVMSALGPYQSCSIGESHPLGDRARHHVAQRDERQRIDGAVVQQRWLVVALVRHPLTGRGHVRLPRRVPDDGLALEVVQPERERIVVELEVDVVRHRVAERRQGVDRWELGRSPGP